MLGSGFSSRFDQFPRLMQALFLPRNSSFLLLFIVRMLFIFPNFETQETPCLNLNISKEQRFLVYADGSKNPVLIPFPDWTSARVSAEIMHILFEEVLQYATELVVMDTNDAGVIASAVAGCPENSCDCSVAQNPKAHFTLMSGTAAIGIVACLPSNVQPILSLVGYQGDDTYYLWQDIIDAGVQSSSHSSLDFYRSYNARFFEPHVFFDPWERLFELLPSSVIVRCSEMGQSSMSIDLTARDTAHYTRITGDTNTSCYHNDSIW